MTAMPRSRFLELAMVAAIATLITGCGTPAPTPGATPTPQASRSPRPSPTPALPPDQETITIQGTGIGAYMLLAVPVVVLHNDASRHGATEVVVHFTTHRANGTTLGSLDSLAVNIGPGESLPVTGNCTDGCNNAAKTDVAVSVGAWVNTIGAVLTPGAATFCASCGGSRAQGNVMGSLSATSVGSGTPVAVFAACQDAGGAIIGGGSRVIIWPGGPSAMVDVPVVLSGTPGTCRLGGSTGW
jgi:hypothetical protein